MTSTLAILFLSLSFAALGAEIPHTTDSFSIEASFRGELCKKGQNTNASMIGINSVEDIDSRKLGMLHVAIDGELTELDTAGKSCEATLTVRHPRGYRLVINNALARGDLIGRAGDELDVGMKLSTGEPFAFNGLRTVRTHDEDHSWRAQYSELPKGQFRSRCSGESEFIVNASATLRSGRTVDGNEIDDISMAFFDDLRMEYEVVPCAPGER